MHEASLMDDLMFAIEKNVRQHKASRVKWVKVRLGAHCHMSASHFRHHFDRAAAGTAAEGADLEIFEDNDELAPHADTVVLESLELETEA